MEKKYAIIPDKTFDKLVANFIKHFGLPKIQRKFSVYAYDNKENQFHINFIDQRCDIKYIPANSVQKLTTPPIFVENKNLKQLFTMIRSLGFNKASIGFILSLNFNTGHEVKVGFSKNTFADNISEIKFNSTHLDSLKQIKTIFKKFKIKLINRNKLKNYISKKSLYKENIFDKFGCLNAKIKKFGEALGVDILSNTKSLRLRLKKFSNDYSIYESWFSKITKSTINGAKSITKNSEFFKPVSIIIPCFNSNRTILKSLYSIESQSLSKKQKSQIEVIIVDDGSKKLVYQTIKDKILDFSFSIKVIRLEQNSGLSTARNIGIFCSTNDFLILIDSDILLPKNYVLEHSVRNQLIPNAVFVSLKKNIENHSKLANIKNIKQGLKSPILIDDLRISKRLKKRQPGIHIPSESVTIEIINDTDYFKNFGFGRTIEAFDLATMVIGHNLSIRRKTLSKCQYFSNHFTGWGLEDSYLGAKLIANGNFVIPVLSSNVYHINHLPRSGSEQKKMKEFKKNIKIYNQLLSREFD